MKKNTKERILLESLNIFSLQGYEGTNLRDLAANLNLSKSAIYRHFSSKEDILNQLIEVAENYYLEKIKCMNIKKDNLPQNIVELKNLTLEHIDFTINDEFVVKCRKFLNIEQYRSKKIAKLASFHAIDGISLKYQSIISNLMDLDVLIRKDVELMTFEYISPISLLINVIDREPERKNECLDLIEKHIDNFLLNLKKDKYGY